MKSLASMENEEETPGIYVTKGFSSITKYYDVTTK